MNEGRPSYWYTVSSVHFSWKTVVNWMCTFLEFWKNESHFSIESVLHIFCVQYVWMLFLHFISVMCDSAALEILVSRTCNKMWISSGSLRFSQVRVIKYLKQFLKQLRLTSLPSQNTAEKSCGVCLHSSLLFSSLIWSVCIQYLCSAVFACTYVYVLTQIICMCVWLPEADVCWLEASECWGLIAAVRLENSS